MIEVVAQTRGGGLNELVEIEIGSDRIVDFEQHLGAHAFPVCLLEVQTVLDRDRYLIANVSKELEILLAEIVGPRAAHARDAELVAVRADQGQTGRLRAALARIT